MKTKITSNNFGPMPAQTRTEFVHLRVKPQQSKHMQKLIAVIMLVCLWAATPLLRAQTIETYTFTTNRLVPDGNAAGLSDVRTINSAISNITSLSVSFKLTGEFNGDLYVYLRHSSGYTVLLNRPGKTSGNAAGYADSGFDVTFQDGAANGNVHLYQTVTTPAAGSPLTGTWQPDGRTNDPANVTDASASTTALSSFNGLNAAGEWTLYVSDLESGGTNMVTEWALQISGQATPALTWPTPADITYGTALDETQLNATATYNGTNVPGSWNYTPASGAVLNAGNNQTLSVTFTPTDTASFLSATTNVPINVLQAPLTITANDTNKIYGADLPTFTASYVGFVNNDTTNNLTTQVTLTPAASKTSPVGTYTITASGAASPNYVITDVNGNLTITPASLMITANDTNKVYGAANPVFTASYSGFTNGDTAASLTTPPSLDSIATAASPAGTYPITASGAAYTNYTISYTPGILTIGTATITVTVDNKTNTYGAALPTLTAVYSGFVPGDNTNSLTALAAITTTATSTSDVGTYPITATNAASTNYSFVYIDGTLTITNALTSGSIVSSANPALPNTSVTFTMTVTAVAPGAGTPTGTVNFRIDDGSANPGALSNGVATFSTTSLTHGVHTVVAEYASTTDFFGVTNTVLQTNNTPPVAGSETIARYPTQGVKVRLSDIFTNASDADHDSLTITVSSASANGGTITTNGGWVFYTPAAGFTNADSFTYTVADGYGGSTTGTITVSILTDDAAGQNLVITNPSGSTYQIYGSGIPGRTYRMQYNDDITNTPNNWLDFSSGSVTADSTGAFQFTDTAGNSGRSYRSVYP